MASNSSIRLTPAGMASFAKCELEVEVVRVGFGFVGLEPSQWYFDDREPEREPEPVRVERDREREVESDLNSVALQLDMVYGVR